MSQYGTWGLNFRQCVDLHWIGGYKYVRLHFSKLHCYRILMSFSRSIYRPDIDSLRAIAVLSVIFYHSKIVGFSGGFIGVDIFFVISGFLITGIIVKSCLLNQFSLFEFYCRRVGRILPLLLTIAVATTVASFFLLLPNEFCSAGKALDSVAELTSNYFF